MDKNFNLIISGVGGHGIITLVKIINQAAFLDGYDVRSSEIHGLAQRGGSVIAHLRFGKKINSPLVSFGSANLIISTELTETLRVLKFALKDTKFLINKKIEPFLNGISEEKIMGYLPKSLYINDFSDNASMLAFALKNKLLPLTKDSVLKSIKICLKEKYIEKNINSFNFEYDK